MNADSTDSVKLQDAPEPAARTEAVRLVMRVCDVSEEVAETAVCELILNGWTR